MKNEQSLHNWQNQSLNFQEMTVLVPGSLFWNKKSKMVLGNSQFIKFDPWIKSLRKLQNWSLKFQKWQKQSLGIFNWKNLHI
jgi:hypothetical protein